MSGVREVAFRDRASLPDSTEVRLHGAKSFVRVFP
jgi:hypothetical protein